jgi:Polyphosphate kinase 2 (PPK2)
MEQTMADKRQKRVAEFIEPFRVRPGSKVTLGKDFDPSFKAGVKKKKEGVALLENGVRLLAEYQARLAAQDTWGCVAGTRCGRQGRDDPPRDERSEPAGCRRAQLQGPVGRGARPRLPLALRAAPARSRGDRDLQSLSLREVLVVRAHPENLDRQKLPDASKKGDVWKRRYRELNDWERYLTDNGFRIVTLFLNLSREEQRARLLRRIHLPDHNWKFSAADLKERALWDDYQKVFSEMLLHTSTEWAPWYVIPADRKWFGRIGAGAVLAHALMEIDPQFPPVSKRQRETLREVKDALEAQAPKGAAPDPFEEQQREAPTGVPDDGGGQPPPKARATTNGAGKATAEPRR